MITEALSAWILHKRWQGETSAQITLFTREYGILRAVYKGGRSPKKQSLLQPFMPMWVHLNHKGEWSYIRSLEQQDKLLYLNGDALFAGLYINELLCLCLKLNDAVAELYDAYEITLQAVSMRQNKSDLEQVLRRFERILLTTCGYHLTFEQDLNGQPLEIDACYQFLPGEGFIKTTHGLLGASILAFAEDRFENPETLKTSKYIMRRAIDYLLDGRPIHTRALYGHSSLTQK